MTILIPQSNYAYNSSYNRENLIFKVYLLVFIGKYFLTLGFDLAVNIICEIASFFLVLLLLSSTWQHVMPKRIVDHI